MGFINNIDELSNTQSEAGIIATLISHPDFLLYSEQLKPNYFFDTTNSCLFWAISELYKSKIENIDAYNLITTIDSNKSIKRQIGEEITPENINTILSLSGYIARDTASEYKKLVSTVSELAFKRKMYKDLDACKADCFKEEATISDIHKNIQKRIDDAAVTFVTSEVKPFSDIVADLWKETTSRFNVTGDGGYSSKFPAAIEYFTYEPNELVLCAAKRKRGKSLFALNESVDKMSKGIGVIYVDTELTDRLFNERLLAHLAQVKFKNLRRGLFNSEEAQRIKDSLLWISQQTFYHLHIPSWDKDKLYLIAKKLKREKNTTFFVFDHLKTTDSADSSQAYHELGRKINFLKDIICGELGYAGLALAQLNRAGDIGDSFKLEQEVSTVINIEKKTEEEILRETVIKEDGTKENCGNYKLFVKANRNGNEMDDIATEYISLMFYGDLCSFSQSPRQHKVQETPF